MSSHATTHNLAEALYLFERSHRLVKVRTARAWEPIGFTEVAFTFEGKRVVNDHWNFVGRCLELDLRGLPELFKVIEAALPKGGA